MNQTLKKIALLASLLILLGFVLFVINQTVQIVELAGRVHPSFGNFVLWALLVIYAALLLIPAYMFLRLPRSLTPPISEDVPGFDAYVGALGKRLASNPHLKGLNLSNRSKVEEALAILDRDANEIIRKTAATVFVSTAISQSGRLDSFLVLSAQSRMVRRIAHLYYQRPSLRDLIHLYANIAGTVFMAGELEDIDIHEQVEPVLSSTLGAMAVAIPGVQLAASILANSVLTGTANAFLTLRVGIIARRYCGSLVVAERRTLRRAASAEAAVLLGSIVKEGVAKLSKAVWAVSKGKAGASLSGMGRYAKETGKSVLARVSLHKRKTVLEEMEAIAEKTLTSSAPEENE